MVDKGVKAAAGKIEFPVRARKSFGGNTILVRAKTEEESLRINAMQCYDTLSREAYYGS